MSLTKGFLFLIIMTGVCSAGSLAKGPAAAVSPALEPLKTSAAFQQYQKRPVSELSKLIFLMDRFKGSNAQVIYDGAHYDSEFALKTAKAYIAKHYKKKQEAALWIRENAYRSDPGRKVILYQESNGSPRPLRDVLLEALEELKSV